MGWFGFECFNAWEKTKLMPDIQKLNFIMIVFCVVIVEFEMLMSSWVGLDWAVLGWVTNDGCNL